MIEWLKSLSLPKGTDLALWWIGVLGVAAIFGMTEAKDVVLTLGGGLVGYIGGRISQPSQEVK